MNEPKVPTDVHREAKYVRGKSEKLVKLFLLIVKSYQVTDPKDWEWQIEDFIRTIVKDCKPKASRAFVWKMVDDSVYILHQERYEFYKKKFTEVGVEVEDK